MVTYSRSELLVERNNLQEAIARLEKEKTRALDERRINPDKFRQINGEQLSLENVLNRYNINLIESGVQSLTVGDDSPGSKLKASIRELNSAINQLNNMRKFLDATADVINEVNGIIKAILNILPVGS